MVHHVVSASTMIKITNINENDALLLGTSIKQDIENTMVKE